MKVFRMNDCDWVAHYSEEEAKTFYQEFTGIDKEEVEEFFEGEVALTDMMYWDAVEVDKKDKNHNFCRFENSPFGDCYKVTFEWAITNNRNLYPGMISTTEY